MPISSNLARTLHGSIIRSGNLELLRIRCPEGLEQIEQPLVNCHICSFCDD
jgi:hypothetical protein